LIPALLAFWLAGAAPVPAPPPSAAAVEIPVVTVRPARPYLVLGTDRDLEIAIEVTGPGAEGFATGRVFTTSGKLEPLRAAGPPGRFSTRYTVPSERFPQVALLVVELVRGGDRLFGSARLPLYGRTEMPFRSDGGAEVTLRIGDRTFGPVVADHQGMLKIPIEVPPGVRRGQARAVARDGNVRETDVDLQPAPFLRVLVAAPAALEVGSFADVWAFATDASGAPVPASRLTLRSSDGIVHPVGAGAGEAARFLVEAPPKVGSGALALTAIVTSAPEDHANVTVPLTPGPAHALALSPSERLLVIGSSAGARVAVSARDRFGNPTPAAGLVALVDGKPVPVEVRPDGQARFTVAAPARWDGRDRIAARIAVGAATATQEFQVTGGAPATLTLQIADPHLVADGHRGTELRVRAADRNGTPTLVPGLSWETPGGRVRRVRVPHAGEYVAEFVPHRARDRHLEAVSVMASQTLRASATVEVAPPPPRVLAGARVGLFSNFGYAAGPALFVEALAPVQIRKLRFTGGLAVGYLRDDVAATGDAVSARLQADQVPVLAIGRYRLPVPLRPEVAIEAGAGISLARTRIVTTTGPSAPPPVEAMAYAPAVQAGVETAFLVGPGRLVVGARYLWIELGKTSHGDELRGNSAGLLVDLGYRMTW
jgi:hypothetical protein